MECFQQYVSSAETEEQLEKHKTRTAWNKKTKQMYYLVTVQFQNLLNAGLVANGSKLLLNC